ncbi:MAG: hypothetical protein MJ194_00455, partial [Clostridia bacterium]|nr:hypothetical protein [Clostridia bacterium]
MRTNSFTKLKRALALVLTFCMVMSGMSLTSFAADDAKPAGSGWQIMDSGNFGAGSKAVDTTKTDAPVTTYSKTSEEDSKVIVSKEISATDTENVFDITLTVKTSEEIIGEVVSPNTATVLVIDTSNSMTTNKDKTDATKTRLVAAQAAANA